MREKSGPTRLGGVLRNYKRDVLFMFFKHAGVNDFNKAKVLAILEALRIYSSSFSEELTGESDSSNAFNG